MLAAGAFAAAALATVLDWVTYSSLSLNPWDDGVRFRLGDWLKVDNADAYIILLLAVAGAFLLFAPRLVPSFPRLPFAVPAVGLALAIIGAIEWQFISDGFDGLDPGVGIYVLGIAGGLAAVGGYLVEQPRGPGR